MTLGQHLKARRQELGRSLEQVSALTRIHIKILTAIEEDAYSELPARAFTRGFIVNYAKALKLEPNRILSTYHDFLEQKFSERPDRDLGHQGYAFEGKELEQNRRWMMFGGGLAVVFALAVLLIFKPENHKRKEKHREFEGETEEVAAAPNPGTISAAPSGSPTPQIPLVLLQNTNSGPNSTSNPLPRTSSLASLTAAAPNNTPTPAASAAPSASPSATPSPSVSSTPSATPSPAASPKVDPMNKGDGLTAAEAQVKATLQAKEDAWIRYKSDELPNGMLILRKGRILVIKGKNRIIFETKNAADLQIKRGGEFKDLETTKVILEPQKGMLPYSGNDLGSQNIPSQVPASKSQ